MRYLTYILLIFCGIIASCSGTPDPDADTDERPLRIGAEQMDAYAHLLEGKQVALVVNHTSRVGNQHLVDTLLSRDVNIITVFGPEHGFRGDRADGEKIDNDSTDNFRIVSLYGANKKPTPEDLEEVDVVVFDIQDVGTRFYTYISTMHLVMEACAEAGIPVLLLDRPNPNDHFIDGPVRKEGYESFVGMHPIPVVHALTIGELAMMINDEGWLKNGVQADLTVIPVANYAHGMPWSLEIPPSPNLPNDHAVAWYPTLCFFEGTPISIGRGTYFPFQVIGYPDSSFGSFSFQPQAIEGMSLYPKFRGEQCYGVDLRETPPPRQIDIDLLKNYITLVPEGTEPFKDYFNTLSGTDTFRSQIESGVSTEEIRASWAEDIATYKQMRKRYLLYPDFE